MKSTKVWQSDVKLMRNIDHKEGDGDLTADNATSTTPATTAQQAAGDEKFKPIDR